METNPERVKRYLDLIAGKRGLERVLEERTGGGLESTEAPEAASARRGVESAVRGRELALDEALGLEALIIPDLRPAIDVVKGKFNVTHKLWTHLNTNAAIRERLERVMPSIGRIELPGNKRYPYGGSGFVVGEGLLMTNRHVAEIFAAGLGERNVDFKPGHKAGIDFVRERGNAGGTTLNVKRVVMIHPYWDMAILAVEGLGRGHQPLKLSLIDITELDKREIAVVGYPAFDPRNDAGEQDELFDETYGVKRLQPGQLHRRADTESFGKIVSAAAHDCSTLGGNSGSGVIDLETGEIVALHFGGRYQDKNFAVPTYELARDGRVNDTGVNFGGSAPGGTPPWSDWWAKADIAEGPKADAGSSTQGPMSGVAGDTAVVKSATSQTRLVASGDGVSIEIPLHITIRLGTPGSTLAASVATESAMESGAGLEAMVEPWRDTRYRSRKGYDEQFLGIKVPMPEPKDPSVLAPTRDSGPLLRYEHFSIVMHATRRLALITASNVTADPRLKKPDPNQTYTRAALSGLGENDQERWFLDPRLDEKYQLPDAFFTKDRQAFDKGHIIRREDVAWGETYAQLRRANGDTYHVTNCSPQTSEFNQSARGHENWGDLENHVLSGASKERLVLFAGPVLDTRDRRFRGTGGNGTEIFAKIPDRFWKVIVAPVEGGVAAFGFVLEQDLSDTPFEYAVSEEFAPYMYALADIEEMAGVKFAKIVADNDQYDSVSGAEVAISAAAPRRRLRRNR